MSIKYHTVSFYKLQQLKMFHSIITLPVYGFELYGNVCTFMWILSLSISH